MPCSLCAGAKQNQLAFSWPHAPLRMPRASPPTKYSLWRWWWQRIRVIVYQLFFWHMIITQCIFFLFWNICEASSVRGRSGGIFWCSIFNQNWVSGPKVEPQLPHNRVLKNAGQAARARLGWPAESFRQPVAPRSCADNSKHAMRLALPAKACGKPVETAASTFAKLLLAAATASAGISPTVMPASPTKCHHEDQRG